MSFASLETSQDDSIPIELYEFTYQGNTTYYTGADTDVTVGSITYLHTALSCSALNDSGEIGKNNITLTAPDQFPASLLFEAGPPDDIVTLVIKRVQYSALDTMDVTIAWIGRIMTVDWPPLRSEISCESIFTSLRQSGLHRVYSINCVFSLYGAECKADIAAFSISATIDNEVGNLLNSADFATQPDGWWSGGKISWEVSPGKFTRRGIKNHTGSQCEITFAIPNFPNGTVVTLSPGCDHTFPTCGSKFSNQINYGGFPFMVQKNPWGGSAIF